MKRVLSSLEALVRPEAVFDTPDGVGDKWALLRWLGARACALAGVADPAPVVSALIERERILSTGIGLGVALPHVRHASVSRETVAVARIRRGMAFDSTDGTLVHAVFCVLAPTAAVRRSVEILGALALSLKVESRRSLVFAAPDPDSFVERLLGVAAQPA